MKDLERQKIKLEQKKNRLNAEEIRLKLKERKMRTRHLIEMGGLIVKAELDHLPISALYGGLLSLVEELEKNRAIKGAWTKLGNDKLGMELREKHAVILKFEEEPDSDIRKAIRAHGLKWNRLRGEWYGFVVDLDSLKVELSTITHNLEIIK